MHEVIVLCPGFAELMADGTLRAAATVTLIRGTPNVIVDTGDAWQRQDILAALGVRGVDPANVAYVINTHGHLDHVGNNNLFPQATFLLNTDVGRLGEYRLHDYAAAPYRIDVPGGGGVINVIPTAGHTDHDLSVLVETSIGIVAVVGDLFEYDEDWVDGAWRAWSKDPAMQQASRGRVLAVADFVVPGHGDIFRVKSVTGG